jgi:hypothetical protein
MTTILVLLVLLLFVGPLALLAGADSRDKDPRRHRAWWPGERGCK